MLKFVKKNLKDNGVPVPIVYKEEKKSPEKEEIEQKPKKIKKTKKVKAMNEEQMNKAEQIVNNLMNDGHVKIVKKDRGLIERTESSKVVLTEDNRQVLGD